MMNKEENLKVPDKFKKRYAVFAGFYSLKNFASDWLLFQRSLINWRDYMDKNYAKLDDEQTEVAMTYFSLHAYEMYYRLKKDFKPVFKSSNATAGAFIHDVKLECDLFTKYDSALMKQDVDNQVKFGQKLFDLALSMEQYKTYAQRCHIRATTNF